MDPELQDLAPGSRPRSKAETAQPARTVFGLAMSSQKRFSWPMLGANFLLFWHITVRQEQHPSMVSAASVQCIDRRLFLADCWRDQGPQRTFLARFVLLVMIALFWPAHALAGLSLETEGSSESKNSIIDLNILFEKNSVKLSRKALKSLEILGEAMNDDRLDGMKFLVETFTLSDSFNDRFLERLSQERVRRVIEILNQRYGVSLDRLIGIGKGSALPVQLRTSGDIVRVSNVTNSDNQGSAEAVSTAQVTLPIGFERLDELNRSESVLHKLDLTKKMMVEADFSRSVLQGSNFSPIRLVPGQLRECQSQERQF